MSAEEQKKWADQLVPQCEDGQAFAPEESGKAPASEASPEVIGAYSVAQKPVPL